MIETITDALKQRTDITAWQVNRVYTRSSQLFLIREETESIRRVETVKYYITIHQEREEDGKKVLGESSFVYIEGEDMSPKLDLAVRMALGVANQPWTLPGPDQRYLDCEIKDASIETNPEKVIDHIKEEIISSVGALEGVRLSSAEVFADYQEYEFVNSLGLKANATDTKILFDFVLLTGEGHDEVESSGYKTVRFYKDLKVRETLKEYAAFAVDSLTAKHTETGKFDVVFAEEALDNLFNSFISHAGGSSAYQGWSRFTKGKPVIEDPEGELDYALQQPAVTGRAQKRPVRRERPCKEARRGDKGKHFQEAHPRQAVLGLPWRGADRLFHKY